MYQRRGNLKESKTQRIASTNSAIIYKEPTRCNFGQYCFFIDNCKFTLHVLDAFRAHHQEY